MSFVVSALVINYLSFIHLILFDLILFIYLFSEYYFYDGLVASLPGAFLVVIVSHLLWRISITTKSSSQPDSQRP